MTESNDESVFVIFSLSMHRACTEPLSYICSHHSRYIAPLVRGYASLFGDDYVLSTPSRFYPAHALL